MTDNTEKKQQAREIYLHTDKTQQEIAEILDVNRRTIYLWIKHGKWEEIKTAARRAPIVLMQTFYGYIDEINARISARPAEDRCPTMQEIEMIRKLLRMARSLDGFSAGTYVQVFEELIRFAGRRDHDLSKKMAEIANQYVMGNFGNDDRRITQEVSDRIANVTSNLAKIKEEELKDTPAPDPTQETKSCDTDATPCDTNAISCDTDGTSPTDTTTPPKPSPIQPDKEKENIKTAHNAPKKIFKRWDIKTKRYVATNPPRV